MLFVEVSISENYCHFDCDVDSGFHFGLGRVAYLDLCFDLFLEICLDLVE